MEDKYKLPIFATATISNVQPAIDRGIINNFGYVFLKDVEKLAFIDEKLQVHVIQGDNPEYIKKVDSLDVESGNETTLYLMNGIYYVFDGEKYEPLFKDINDKIAIISDTLLSIADYMSHNDQSIVNINQNISDLTDNIEELEADMLIKYNTALNESKAYTDSALTIIEFRGSEVDNEF